MIYSVWVHILQLGERQQRTPQRRKMQGRKERRLQNEKALIRAKVLGRGRLMSTDNTS